MWRDNTLLLDILLAAEDAREFARGLDWTRFSISKLHQSAIIRCLEIIGEAPAVDRISQTAHPAGG